MTNFVQQYRSTDLNAPPLSGQSGSLIKLLNAALVDGYGYSGISITGITKSGTTATATVSAADGLRLQTGMILTMSGCTGADASLYNITAAITVASTTTFTYTMGGTPTGSATGTPVCSTFLPITGITRSAAVATATLTNANSTLVTGNYITVSGATGADASLYNGTFPITVNSSTSISYTMTGTPTGSATGTLVYTKAGLGWTRPFSAGTNSQTYRSADAGSNQFYLQVIDNAATAGGALEAQIYGAEVMSADQTVTSGQFPTVAQKATGLCVRKSATAASTQRAWTIFGDDRTFYIFPQTGDAGTWGAAFGHFLSFRAGDGFNTFIVGGSGFNTTNVSGSLFSLSAPGYNATAGAVYIARTNAQTGAAVGGAFVGMSGSGSNGAGNVGANAVVPYPNPADSGLYCSQHIVVDGACFRGRLPGIYAPMHNAPFSNYDVSTGITGLTGVTLTCIVGNQNAAVAQLLVDTFGPWV